MTSFDDWIKEIREHLTENLKIVTDGNQQFALIYPPSIGTTDRKVPCVVYSGFRTVAGAELARENIINTWIDRPGTVYGPSEVTPAMWDESAAAIAAEVAF